MNKTLSDLAVAFAIIAFIQPTHAQQTEKVYRIGTLLPGAPNSNRFLNWFRQGMSVLGYAEGRNYVLVSRWAR